MTYNPNIPQATDNISVDQPKILTNFSQANTLFGLDHFSFNNATVANRGLHQQVTFPTPLGAAPTPSNPEGILYPLADPNDTSSRTQLYFKNGSTSFQVTNRFTNSGSGYSMMPGGIIFMWGIETSITSGTHTVTFPTISNYNYVGPGFPTAAFNVQISVSATSSAGAPVVVVDEGSLNANRFRYRVSATVASTDLYWMAIGN